MSTPETADLKAQWRDLVGGFILAFGDIEFASFYLWSQYFPGSKPPHNFKERTGAVVAKLSADGSAKQVVAESLVEALRISDKRNTVAHHPLQVQVFQHTPTGRLVTALGISSELTDDFITDQELAKLRAQAEQLRTTIYRALWPKERGDG